MREDEGCPHRAITLPGTHSSHQRNTVRSRPFIALSLAAAAAFVLAGCASGTPDATSSTPASTASADLCSAVVASGAATDAVTVEGEFDKPATATFTAPLTVDTLQAKVITEGTGTATKAGDLITYALTAFDAQTGQQVGDAGYTSALLPTQIEASSALGKMFGCAAPGTRVVAAFPAQDGQSGAQVFVVDLLDNSTPSKAWGQDQDPQAGFPTVALADSGEPTITLPGGDAPTDVAIETLKRGDGATVADGDTVLVQYTGVKWSDGSVFDSSWTRGAPASFATNQVVPGFSQALVGQTVGSQVLVVIPPAFGYGEASADNSAPLAGETLVFVIDILATQAPSAN